MKKAKQGAVPVPKKNQMALFPLTEFSVIQIITVIYSRSFCKRKDTVSQKMYSLLVLTVSANLVG